MVLKIIFTHKKLTCRIQGVCM